MTGKKSVLFVMDSMGSGGGQKSLVSLLYELEAYKDELEVSLLLMAEKGLFLGQIPDYVTRVHPSKEMTCMMYAPGTPEFRAALCPRGVVGKLERIASAGLMRRLHPDMHDIQLFWRHWRRFVPEVPGEYDVAVGYLEGTTDYVVMDKAHARRRVCFIHSDYNKICYSRYGDKDYFERADAVVTVSDVCLSSLRENFPDIQPDKFCVLENITSRRQVAAMAAEPVSDARTEGVANLLTVGRFFPVKGYDMLVEAAAILRDRGVRFVWRIVGEGPLEGDVRADIEAKGLGGSVLLMGAKPNPYPYMAGCDVFVQTSRYEGKSIVVDEAKALARPIVVTNYPTARDVIEDGRNGLVCDMTPEGIAGAVERILDEPALAEGLRASLANDDAPIGSSVDEYLAVILGE